MAHTGGRAATSSSSVAARPSDTCVSGSRHSGERSRPCRQRTYLSGIGLASEKSLGIMALTLCHAFRARTSSCRAMARVTATKVSVARWEAARMPPAAPLAKLVK